MRYASIRNLDISNGDGIGVALFVQGCPFHCYNCFNPQTWDFDGGKEWNDDIRGDFLDIIQQCEYSDRVTIIGGEPLCEQNRFDVGVLISDIKTQFPHKKIWLYTGYTWEELIDNVSILNIIEFVDVIVDGRYIDELRDITLPFRGSSNQRIIDVKKSLEKGEVILYEQTNSN